MTNGAVKLGISISGNQIRFLEAEDWNGRLNVMSVLQSKLPQSFDYSVIGDESLVPQVAELLDKSLENFTDDVSSARLSIDRRLLMKKTFAVDKSLSEPDISKHIEWELEQALVSPRDEYNVGFEHVNLQSAKSDIVVYIAARKALINYIKEIFKKSRLSLEAIDVDLFANIRALNQAYGEKMHGVSALIDLDSAGAGYTILVDGHYAISAERSFEKDGEKVNIAEISSGELAPKLDAELKHLGEYIEEELNISTLHRVFIAGDAANRDVADELQKLQLSASVQVAEPFQNVHRQLNIESQMLIDNHATSFMSCLGMVL